MKPIKSDVPLFGNQMRVLRLHPSYCARGKSYNFAKESRAAFAFTRPVRVDANSIVQAILAFAP